MSDEQPNEKGIVPGEPPFGTGEVVIAASQRPPTDKWGAEWHDSLRHNVEGPQDATLDECLSWAMNEAHPARVVIWTQNVPSDDVRQADPNAGVPHDQFYVDQDYRPPQA